MNNTINHTVGCSYIKCTFTANKNRGRINRKASMPRRVWYVNIKKMNYLQMD